jgi:hypothetical protein
MKLKFETSKLLKRSGSSGRAIVFPFSTHHQKTLKALEI